MRILVLLAVIVLAPSSLAIPADGDQPGKLTLQTERVVVFKNGYALFVKRAVGSADETGMVHTTVVPDAAVLGTVWALAERDASILNMTAEWIEEDARRELTPCVSMVELLRANVGRKVELELPEERRISAEIIEILEYEPDAVEPPPSPQPPVARHLLSPVPAPAPAVHGGNLVAVATREGGRLVLGVAAIRSISGPDLITEMEREVRAATRSKRLSIAYGRSAAGRQVSLRLFYFTPSVRWIPTYRISGDLESSARLALQGEILNEAEPIDAAALDLVVGVPNFRFNEVVSPLSLERTLRQTLRETAPAIMGQGALSNVATQRMTEWRAAPGEPAAAVEGLPELSMAGEQDLFVYSVPTFTLAKGGRATVALWQNEVPLRHLYTLDLDIVRHGRSGGRASRQSGMPDLGDASPLRLERRQVWHQLELTNDGDVPWTTGAALLMRDALPLGQELLTYTSIGGETLVPVTVAVDVRAGHEEKEIERQPDAIVVSGTRFTLVRKAGTITLTNYRTESSRIRVRASFGGRAEAASDEGRIVINDFRAGDWEQQHYMINQHSDIEWELDLAAGAEKTLTYESSFYVH
jgi:hypothetical protein